MTQDQFNSLISETVAMYSSSQGSILYLREQGNNSEPISICLSSLRNQNRIVPSECIVWDDDRVLYEGNIRSKKLYNKLKKYSFCCAEITSARDLNKRRGELCCLGCREECDNKKCPCKKETFANKQLNVATIKFSFKTLSKRICAEA